MADKYIRFHTTPELDLKMVDLGDGTHAYAVAQSKPVDILPDDPQPTEYLPVRLTNGTDFYNATGGGGGGVASEVEVTNFPEVQEVSGQVEVTNFPAPPASQSVTGTVSVDNFPPFPASQPVTGQFWQTTQPVSVSTLPLPTGASTGAKQDTGNASLASIDGKLDALTTPQDTQPVSGSVSVSNFPATQPVTGTFWQATQPVSGPLTDAQLRATAVPVSGTFWQGTQPVSASSLPLPTGASTEATLASVNTKTPALGQAAMAASTPVVIASNQSAVPVSMAAASVLFRGRASTFRTPGRAGTAGQKILALFNANGSAVVVTLNKVMVDAAFTVVKAITVLPPMIRLWKVTAAPTNGTVLAKTKIGGTGSTNASVEVRGDAGADGTGSGTTLTATLPAGAIITQEFAPRFVTAVGYEPADRIEFELGGLVTLAANEGVVLFLDYTAATQNPTSDQWIASMEWVEN